MLDRLHTVFCTTDGRLGRAEFIAALCAACNGVKHDAKDWAKERELLLGVSPRDAEDGEKTPTEKKSEGLILQKHVAACGRNGGDILDAR